MQKYWLEARLHRHPIHILHFFARFLDKKKPTATRARKGQKARGPQSFTIICIITNILFRLTLEPASLAAKSLKYYYVFRYARYVDSIDLVYFGIMNYVWEIHWTPTWQTWMETKTEIKSFASDQKTVPGLNFLLQSFKYPNGIFFGHFSFTSFVKQFVSVPGIAHLGPKVCGVLMGNWFSPSLCQYSPGNVKLRPRAQRKRTNAAREHQSDDVATQ